MAGATEEDNDRRTTGFAEPRAVLWDDAMRSFVTSLLAEVFAESERRQKEAMSRALGGIEPDEHASQHEGFTELIPWIQAQKKKAQAQADFWERLRTKNLERLASFVLWVLTIALVSGLAIGLIPALRIALKKIGALP